MKIVKISVLSLIILLANSGCSQSTANEAEAQTQSFIGEKYRFNDLSFYREVYMKQHLNLKRIMLHFNK